MWKAYINDAFYDLFPFSTHHPVRLPYYDISIYLPFLICPVLTSLSSWILSILTCISIPAQRCRVPRQSLPPRSISLRKRPAPALRAAVSNPASLLKLEFVHPAARLAPHNGAPLQTAAPSVTRAEFASIENPQNQAHHLEGESLTPQPVIPKLAQAAPALNTEALRVRRRRRRGAMPTIWNTSWIDGWYAWTETKSLSRLHQNTSSQFLSVKILGSNNKRFELLFASAKTSCSRDALYVELVVF